MVTGTINGQEVTVPAGTVILEAARMAGIEVPKNAKIVSPIEIFDRAVDTVTFLGAHLSSVGLDLTDAMRTRIHAVDVAFAAR